MGLISEFLNDFYWKHRKGIFITVGVWGAVVIGCLGWLIAMIFGGGK